VKLFLQAFVVLLMVITELFIGKEFIQSAEKAITVFFKKVISIGLIIFLLLKLNLRGNNPERHSIN